MSVDVSYRGYLAGISSLQRRSTEPTQHGQR